MQKGDPCAGRGHDCDGKKKISRGGRKKAREKANKRGERERSREGAGYEEEEEKLRRWQWL